MPALAGRGGRTFERGSTHGYREMDGTWVEEEPGPRESRMRDEKFVLRYLTLKGLPAKEAKTVREVVIVTQGQLLSQLLGISETYSSFCGNVLICDLEYDPSDFPNATAREAMSFIEIVAPKIGVLECESFSQGTNCPTELGGRSNSSGKYRKEKEDQRSACGETEGRQ